MILDDPPFLEGIACPECGELALCWSRSQALKEDVVRSILPGSYYRCRLCDWRGLMFHRESFGEWRFRFWHSAWTLVTLLFLVACGCIAVLYVVRNTNPTAPPQGGEQTRPVPPPPTPAPDQ